MATRRQSASNASPGDPASATFGSTPISGNLLKVTATERSGTGAAAFTISGSGWTKRIAHDNNLADSTLRKSMAVWTKVAGASEPTNIQVDNATANNKRILIEEFAFETGEDQWDFQAEESGDTGTGTNQTSVSSGTTAAVTGTEFLSTVSLYAKIVDDPAGTESASFTNGLGTNVAALSAANGQTIISAMDGDDTSTAGYETTATYSATPNANSGLIAGIMVLSIVAGGAASAFPHHYYQMMRG